MNHHPQVDRHSRPAGRRGPLLAPLLAALLLWLTPLLSLAAPLPAGSAEALSRDALVPTAVTTLDGAGPDRDLGAVNPRDYMTVSLTTAQPSLVRVSFTGYAFAKSSAAGVQTPGCPCLVRGELRANQEPGQIVTRTVLATDAADAVGNPGATPPVAVADRRNLTGSHVFNLPAGDHTITMSLRREVGTADNIGFAFGRMQADTSPMMPTTMPRTGLGAAESTTLTPWLLAAGLVLLGLAGWRRVRNA